MRAVRVGLDSRVDGHRRDGSVRRAAADGPEHRAAGPADRRLHSRGDGTAVQGRRAGHDIVLGLGRHTGRTRVGHVPRMAASVRVVLDHPVHWLRSHMVHTRVTRVATRQRLARVGRTGQGTTDGGGRAER